jgi:hypothetical protein
VLPIALDTADSIQLAIAIITAVAALTAVATVLLTVANERKRTQPIVISNEARGRHMSDSPVLAGAWVVDAYLTSEGAGPAFNGTFGVEFHGVRYPYRLRSEDPSSGNVQRVLQPGERRPEGSWPILIDSTELYGVAAAGGDPDPGRVYWARYENAQGQVWETRNPGDRSARLRIRRVRLRRLREWREEQQRKKARKYGVEWERKALAELRSAVDQAKREETDPPETGASPK